jgi:protein O-GlcNAc transferase
MTNSAPRRGPVPQCCKTTSLSIVFSTRGTDPNFIAHLRSSVGLPDVEILSYENPGTQALTALYNRGLREASAGIVLFIHDDIHFNQRGWGRALLKDFQKTGFGILGIAGTTDLARQSDGTIGPWWHWWHRTVGRVTHEIDGQRQEDVFSNSFERPIPVVCLDGVLLAVDRRRLRVPFDERFGGFHYYDVPFTFANHLAGVPVGVTFSIRLTHRSRGQTDAAWESNRLLFSQLFGEHLPYGIAPEAVRYEAAPIKAFNPGPGLVSIIIPTRDHLELLLDCVSSLIAHTRSAHYEILIADTGSLPENKRRLVDALGALHRPANLTRIEIIEYDFYNFAKINNDMVQRHLAADSRYLIFCNNDIKLLNDAVDRCLRQFLARTDIGTLGIRLHTADNAIQHNGITAEFGRGQVVEFIHRNWRSYYRYDDAVIEVIGNSGAFLMVERQVFAQAPFNEAYAECYEDVELNLRLRLLGRRNYQVGHAVAYHYEGQTRKENPDILNRQITDYQAHLLPFFTAQCVPLFFSELFAGAGWASRNGLASIALAMGKMLLQHAPRNADIHHLLGVIQGRAGHQAEATHWLQQAIALDARNPAYHFNLAEAWRHQDQWAAAAQAYRQALLLAPDMVDAHWRLAQVLTQEGLIPEALNAYREVMKRQPHHFVALREAAELLWKQDAHEAASACYQQALKVVPTWAIGHHYLGMLLQNMQRYEDAARSFREALRHAPDAYESWLSLGTLLEGQGDIEGARDAYRRVADGEGEHPLFRLRLAALCPPVFPSVAAIDDYRATVGEHLAKWVGVPVPPLNLERLHGSLFEPPYGLAYQGRDDHALKSAWAGIFGAALPEAPPPRSLPGKPRVGFLVTRGHEGSFLRTMAGILNRLPAEHFDLILACSGSSGESLLRQGIHSAAVTYLPFPDRFDQSVPLLREARFNLLYFWEVGSDSLNYFLPFFRLAPVQCTGWGWPVTSGIPALDYYLSSAQLETPESDAHYSERLIRLPRLPAWIDRPATPPAPLERRGLGLPDAGPMYLCVQNPLKIHPDFDSLAAGVLRCDPHGILVMVEHQHALITRALRARLQSNLGDLAKRVHWLPRQAHADYLALLATANVVLDTPHFGGGLTTYDTFAMGTPLITCPGAFSRGRYAYAAYRQMGINEGIAADADDYVTQAVRLANDPNSRRIISKANAELFEDQQAIKVFSDFLEQALSLDTHPLRSAL